MNAYLDLDHIEVSYAGVTALHPLSLGIQRGEFFCLLGPSGCGKSTTLGVVAGFLPASRGRVLIDERDVTSLPPQQRQIGVVFQSYALFPHMTIAENVGYGLKMRPLSNLDARLREQMRSELKRIQRTTGVTTIFVTHDQEEAFGVGDRIAVLNQGRLEQVGTPVEIYGHPKTSFVAKFIGRSNCLRGQLSADGEFFQVNGVTFRSDTRQSARITKWHVLYLRPEELLLSTAPERSNSVPGTVTEIVYGGAVVNYRIRCDLGALDACRLAGQQPVLLVGDAVHVGWEPGSGTLLPDGALD